MAGSAGTGKTIVALHRAVCLARKHEDARILLTTFSEPLAQALFGKLQRLIGNEPRLAERIDVCSMASLGRRLWRAHFGGAEPKLASDANVREAIAGAIPVCGGKFSPRFLFIEWRDIIDAWQLPSWESYRDVPRLGRRTRLPEARRLLLWELFASMRERLSTRGFLTESAMLTRLAAVYGEAPVRAEAQCRLVLVGRTPRPQSAPLADSSEVAELTKSRAKAPGAGLGTRPTALFGFGKTKRHWAEALGKLKLAPLVRARTPYDFAVVDEAQDVSVAQLRFLAAVGRDRPDALFFAGDLGQRIFQTPFSWKALGVDIRGRSTTLKVNYRTSHQIRTSADRLLDSSVTDGDGIGDERKGTTSVFNGPCRR